MKKNQRRLNALLKMFKDINLFYSITLDGYSIRLQGNFDRYLTTELLSLKFKQQPIDGNGHLLFKRSDITVVLT